MGGDIRNRPLADIPPEQHYRHKVRASFDRHVAHMEAMFGD